MGIRFSAICLFSIWLVTSLMAHPVSPAELNQRLFSKNATGWLLWFKQLDSQQADRIFPVLAEALRLVYPSGARELTLDDFILIGPALEERRFLAMQWLVKESKRSNKMADLKGLAIKALSYDQNDGIRCFAAEIISSLVSKDQSLISVLQDTLTRDSSWRVKQVAAVTLFKMGLPSVEGITYLAQAAGTQNFSQEDKELILKKLVEYGKSDSQVAAVIESLLTQDFTPTEFAFLRNALQGITGTVGCPVIISKKDD